MNKQVARRGGWYRGETRQNRGLVARCGPAQPSHPPRWAQLLSLNEQLGVVHAAGGVAEGVDAARRKVRGQEHTV